MYPLRATGFVNSSRIPLERVASFPRLPNSFVLDRVVGVAIDSRGYVYFAHRGEHPLVRLHPDGRFDREIGGGLIGKSIAYNLSGPTPVPIATRYWMHGLHVDPWDNVWLTDVGRHLVMKFDREGALVMTLGTDGVSGCDGTHFAQPTHVCVAPGGDIFVTDGYGNSRVVCFDAKGAMRHSWGERGTEPGQFHTPHVIVRDADGRLYVTDRENDRIQVFEESGKVITTWEGLHSVDGLCVGHDGHLYASGGIDNAVLRLRLDGRVEEVWAPPGAFVYPHAVAVDRAGHLYVAESGDAWRVVGRKPAERFPVERTGPEGSRLAKFRIP